MKPTTEESDALTIARWCWPEEPWEQAMSETTDSDRWEEPEVQVIRSCPHCKRSMDRFWYPSDPEHVHAAERVMIERGHGKSYAAVLLDHLDIGIQAWCCDHAEVIATAPLEVRVRAMAAVIRGLGKGSP